MKTEIGRTSSSNAAASWASLSAIMERMEDETLRDVGIVLAGVATLAVAAFLGLPRYWVIWWAGLFAVAIVVLWIKRRYW